MNRNTHRFLYITEKAGMKAQPFPPVNHNAAGKACVRPGYVVLRPPLTMRFRISAYSWNPMLRHISTMFAHTLNAKEKFDLSTVGNYFYRRMAATDATLPAAALCSPCARRPPEGTVSPPRL